MNRNMLATLFAIVLLSGCGRPTYDVAEADQLYFDALTASENQNHADALALLDSAITIQPGHYMYLKRAELHLRQGNDEAAQGDLAQAATTGARPEDCQWLKSEAAKPVGDRFQGALATPPSQNK